MRRCTNYSAVTLAALMTPAHFWISTGIMAPSSAGDLIAAVMPSEASTFLASSFSKAFTTAR